MNKLARLGMVLLLTLGMTAAMPPPARATTIGTIAVQGTASVGNGIALPCLTGIGPVPPGVPVFDINKCLPPHSGNNAAVVFTGSGVGAVANGPTKAGKAGTVEAGTFAITAGGRVFGACGNLLWNLAGNLTPTVSVGTKAKARAFTITLTEVGGLAIVNGMTSKGESIAGVVLAFVTTGSCVNKQPKLFTIVGSLALSRVP